MKLSWLFKAFRGTAMKRHGREEDDFGRPELRRIVSISNLREGCSVFKDEILHVDCTASQNVVNTALQAEGP